jgi:asparaginyl-tRNA synthetase
MKAYYIKDILNKVEPGQEVEILGWIASKRDIGGIIFLDLVDSTGKIQAVVRKDIDFEVFTKVKGVIPESSVKVRGTVKNSNTSKEVLIQEIEIVGDVLLEVTPRPRSLSNIFHPKFADLILTKRHLYLRNEKLMAVLRFRYELVEIIREWFRKEGFVEIHAPILTQLSLYDDSALFDLEFFGEKVFLTHCVAFYLESAVHAFERVYSISPSFRAEKSRGRRHLAEFWQVKAEIAFADLDDIIDFAENMISYVMKRVVTETRELLGILDVRIDVGALTKTPYPRISYSDALAQLRAMGVEKEWGRSLSDSDVATLSKAFDTPFWVTGNPRSIEPFPYRIDPSNPQVAKVADLIATDGFGELLGVAEKIWEMGELCERMEEKGKDTDRRYEWYRELRQFGSVPHSGLGMGIERMVRWLLRLNHVRDAIAFPRLFGRVPNP